MPTLSIKWRQSGQPTRVVIIVVIYLAVLRFLPQETMPLVLGSLIARALVVKPNERARASATLEPGQ
jgi:hypothetical protein